MVLRSGIRDPGSEIRDPEKTYSGSRIQGSKRHRTPDPGSGSATLPQEEKDLANVKLQLNTSFRVSEYEACVQVTDYLQGVVTRVQCLGGGEWTEEPVTVTSTVYAHRSTPNTLLYFA
jgi:hypothetical protein